MPNDLSNPFDLSADTRKRFEEELLELRFILQAALHDAGELEEERPDWTFSDLVPEQPSRERPIVSCEYRNELAALIAVTSAVHETHASLFGVREQMAKAFGQAIEGLDNIAAIAEGPAFRTYLANTSAINRACGMTGEQSAEIAQVVLAVLEKLQPAETANLVRVGEQHLNLRRAPAILEGFYRARGRGPEGHALFEAWDIGFDSHQIAKYRLFRALRRPGLHEAEKLALIDDEAERIEARLRDYRKSLQPHWRGFSGDDKITPQGFFYRAFSMHVEPRSQLALHSGSRDGLPGFCWHSSPLDSDGTPTELPPWEAPGSSAGSA